jgi:FlaA1/EpsC-like NDP-sugar epimerase
MRDANPVVYLVPGVGMITFAADKATARIAGEFYVNAINVMRGAASVSNYRGLPEQEAFDIEYWDLEEAKLQRMPKPKALAGRVALITGGAGGIGLATCERLMDEGRCVVICDIDRDALAGAEAELKKNYGADVVASSWVDVTREDAVSAAFRDSAWKVRRRRHLHFQRRHRLGLAGRRTRRSRSGRRTWTSWPRATS